MRKLLNLDTICYHNLSYSPDLTPSDFHLFLQLKLFLEEKQFSTEGDIKLTSLTTILEDLQNRTFVIALEHRWSNCIEPIEDFVKEQNI